MASLRQRRNIANQLMYQPEYNDNQSLQYKIYEKTNKPMPFFQTETNEIKETVKNIDQQLLVTDNIMNQEIPERKTEQKKHLLSKSIIVQPIGFSNLGNTCYMNSFLQALLSSNVLNTLIALYIQQNPDCFDKMCPIMLEYCRLIIDLMEPVNQNNENILNHYSSPYSPSSFKRTLDEQNPWFRGSQQHDADEFMLYCINEFIDPKKNPDLARLIKKMCFGRYKQYLRCNECEYVSEEFFDFLNVQLPIPAKKPDRVLDLEDCFKEFAKYERLDGKNMQKCSNCKKKVVAYKKMVISKTPEVAIFTLIRYRDANGRRDLTPIQMFKYISLEKKKLKLVATVNHSGGTGSGHYVANVLRKGVWYNMNDSYVSKIADTQINKMLTDPSIYMVIYQADE